MCLLPDDEILMGTTMHALTIDDHLSLVMGSNNIPFRPNRSFVFHEPQKTFYAPVEPPLPATPNEWRKFLGILGIFGILGILSLD